MKMMIIQNIRTFHEMKMKLCPLCDKPLVAVWSAEDDTHWKCETCPIKIFMR
jgi:hypothetical protein